MSLTRLRQLTQTLTCFGVVALGLAVLHIRLDLIRSLQPLTPEKQFWMLGTELYAI